MRDPYEVLGVSRSATTEEIKKAYRELAKKYHSDNYTDSPQEAYATERMQEINEAYDAILSGNVNAYKSGGSSDYTSYYAYSSNESYDAQYVSRLIDANRIKDAEYILSQVPISNRDAQWYYFMGRVCFAKGWYDKASSYYSTAHSMDPSNPVYEDSYESMKDAQMGGYRKSRRSSEADALSCCCDLLCLDSLCECFGFDCIPCC